MLRDGFCSGRCLPDARGEFLPRCHAEQDAARDFGFVGNLEMPARFLGAFPVSLLLPWELKPETADGHAGRDRVWGGLDGDMPQLLLETGEMETR